MGVQSTNEDESEYASCIQYIIIKRIKNQKQFHGRTHLRLSQVL